ncbi:PIN/TRAM domain-containing protein [Candidatus Omnitrophota bacterium]
MALWLIRIFFVGVSGVVGYGIGQWYQNPYLGVALALGISLIVAFFEAFTKQISLRGLSSAVFGFLLGILMARILMGVLNMLPIKDPTLMETLNTLFTLIFAYIGLVLGMRGQDEFHLVIPYVRLRRQQQYQDIILIDTSVVIDGRIVDIIKTGFIEARFFVPRFILKEIQVISDSQDPIKRQRGQRALEILKTLQGLPDIELKIHEQEVEGRLDTDAKLVKLAQLLDAKIMTTDYNLNRVAALQKVKVLNINELSETLKPVLLPGERFSLKLIREGKEYNQAVGYLDDGTMVVVENARWLIGKSVKVEVASILQSPSGRIIFTKVAS